MFIRDHLHRSCLGIGHWKMSMSMIYLALSIGGFAILPSATSVNNVFPLGERIPSALRRVAEDEQISRLHA